MRSSVILVSVVAAAVSAARCGGSSSPTAPGPVTPSVVTVAIVGLAGSGSYQPNPVQTGGNQVMFKNNDTVNTHRIVMDDGSGDFGTLAPGASSQARSVSGGNFHCTIHPSMVGSINGATAPAPAPGSGDGY
jgi:plastocyanin